MVVNFIVKTLGTDNLLRLTMGWQKYEAQHLVLARSLVSFSLCFISIHRKGIPFWGTNRKWLFVRGLCGVIALTLFFFTLLHLPLAVATIVQYVSPIFTVLLALIILKEKILRWQWFFIFMAFCGVLVLSSTDGSKQWSSIIDPLWLSLGIISAAFSAIAYIAIVKLKPTDEPIVIVMYFPLVSLPILLIWFALDPILPHSTEWILLLLLGIFTQMAQLFMTKSLHSGATSAIVPFQYFGAIYACFIGVLLFDESLEFSLYLGLFLIVSSVVGNSLYRYYSQKLNP